MPIGGEAETPGSVDFTFLVDNDFDFPFPADLGDPGFCVFACGMGDCYAVDGAGVAGREGCEGAEGLFCDC